jgi:hypothetical protein
MAWHEAIERGFPPPYRGEPGNLRRDIADELADHLALFENPKPSLKKRIRESRELTRIKTSNDKDIHSRKFARFADEVLIRKPTPSGPFHPLSRQKPCHGERRLFDVELASEPILFGMRHASAKSGLEGRNIIAQANGLGRIGRYSNKRCKRGIN